MFQSGNIQGITKCILLSVLALSTECFAAVNKDDNIYNFSTRRPYDGEQFTVPTHSPKFSDPSSDDADHADMVVFFVIMSISTVIIGILIYILNRGTGSTSSRSATSRATILPRVAGATVHPPPGRLAVPTAPVVSYSNHGYQNDATTAVDGRPADELPDYATVTIGDLASQEKSRYPTVMPKLETPPPHYPPPNYPVGHP